MTKQHLIDMMNTPIAKVEALTKRELFAAMAMQGMLAAIYSSKEMLNEFTRDEDGMHRHLTGCDAVTRASLNYADALLKRLEPKEAKSEP